MPQLVAAGAAAALSAGISKLAVGTAAQIALQIGGAVALTAAAQALTPSPQQADGGKLLRELRLPDGPVPYRYAYGETRVVGTYVGVHVVGPILYACLLLNSRPSAGPFTLYFDGRQAPLDTGDPYDFDADGAEVDDPTDGLFDGFAQYWIGRGDQTKCPDRIVSETSGHFTAADAWEGRTVLWLRLKSGGSETRARRWPSVPPAVDVEGRWSLVYDPREAGHDAADPSTWEWADNLALCLLDALRQNPVQAYAASEIRMDTFETAADACDEAVALKAGGTQPRYRVGGVLVWGDAELEDQVAPLVEAGAAQLVRLGGRLAMIAGVAQTASHEVDDLLEDLRYVARGNSDELPTELRVSYRAPGRGYEAAELAPWAIPGALAADGGVPKVRQLDLSMVTSAQQAMRVRKIVGLRARAERELSGVLPPRFFGVVPGSAVTVALPAPFGTALDGAYRVASVNPGLDPLGTDGGVALRLPAVLREDPAAAYAWDAATEEEDVADEDVDLARSAVTPPGSLSGTYQDVDTGGAIQPQLRFQFERGSLSTEAYEWEYQRGTYVAGELNWRPGGYIANRDFAGAATTDVLSGYLEVASTVQPHSVRVRAVLRSGAASSWVTLIDASATFAIASPGGSAGPGAGEATFTGTAPATTTFGGWRLYRAASGAGFGAASLIGGLRAAAPGASISEAVTGLAAGAADFWLVPVSKSGSEGPEAGPVSLTIT